MAGHLDLEISCLHEGVLMAIAFPGQKTVIAQPCTT